VYVLFELWVLNGVPNANSVVVSDSGAQTQDLIFKNSEPKRMDELFRSYRLQYSPALAGIHVRTCFLVKGVGTGLL